MNLPPLTFFSSLEFDLGENWGRRVPTQSPLPVSSLLVYPTSWSILNELHNTPARCLWATVNICPYLANAESYHTFFKSQY